MKLENMSNEEIIVLLEKFLQERLEQEFGKNYGLSYDKDIPNLLINHIGEDLDNLKSIPYAKILTVGKTYFKVQIFGDNEPLIIEKKNMYRNELIELLSNVEDKEELYNAIYEDKVVRYTRNRRGIPAKTFIAENDKYYYEFIIEPSEKLMCYTDFDLGTIEHLLAIDYGTFDSAIEDILYSKKELTNDFENASEDVIKHFQRKLLYQYSSDSIIRYILDFKLKTEFLEFLQKLRDTYQNNNASDLKLEIINKLLECKCDKEIMALIDRINKVANNNLIVEVESVFDIGNEEIFFNRHYYEIEELRVSVQKVDTIEIVGDLRKFFSYFAVLLTVHDLLEDFEVFKYEKERNCN